MNIDENEGERFKSEEWKVKSEENKVKIKK